MFFFFFFFAHNVRKGQEMIYKSFTSPGILPTWIQNRTSYLITYLFIHKMLPGAAFGKTTETKCSYSRLRGTTYSDHGQRWLVTCVGAAAGNETDDQW